MKGMNTASKRVPQFNPPTLSNTGVQIIHQTYPNNAVEFFLFSNRFVVVYNTHAIVRKATNCTKSVSQYVHIVSTRVISVDFHAYFGLYYLIALKNLVLAASVRTTSQKKNRLFRRFSIDIILLIDPEVFENTGYYGLRHRLLEVFVVDLLILRGVTNVAQE